MLWVDLDGSFNAGPKHTINVSWSGLSADKGHVDHVDVLARDGRHFGFRADAVNREASQPSWGLTRVSNAGHKE